MLLHRVLRVTVKHERRQRETTRYGIQPHISAKPGQAYHYPADVNRKLAEVHYAARVTELRDLIFQEETRFK